MSNNKITVHAENEHICGQVHEVIYHLKDGGFDISIGVPPFELSRGLKEFSLHVDVEPEQKLEFSGSCGKVELNGLKWEKGSGIVCKKCGMDMVHGLVAEE